MSRPGVSFHTTGSRLEYNGSYIIVNQAYVQYLPPVASPNAVSPSRTSNLPILFVHGGGLTGAMWESTPDRRPGWAVLSTRPPYSRPTYCIDAVDSGRSQKCPETLRDGPSEYRTVDQLLERFRLGPLKHGGPQSLEHEDFKFPLEHLDRLAAAQSTRRRGKEQYDAEAKGIRDAISELGQCDVIAHSNGASTCTFALLDQETRSKVRRFAMVEPAWALTENMDHLESVKTLIVWGDHLTGHAFWQPILKHYENMKGDITIYDLPKMGFKGSSHFPMHDRNSDDIGRLILDWLREV